MTEQNKMLLSDIHTDHFVFKATPPAWHPYIKLARLDRPIGTWLLLFPCWWSIVLASGGVRHMTPHAWALMGWMALGALLMRSAGCIVNDLWDRKLDAGVERTKTRPLASGEMNVAQALRFLGVLLALSFLILIQLSPLAIGLGVLSLTLVVSYPKMKKITWWPQLFLGFTFNWGALLGWAAVTNSLSWESLLLYIGGIFWTLGYDTIYAHQDAEDDALAGIKSTARLFAEKSPCYVAVFYALSLAFLMKAKYIAHPEGLVLALVLFPALFIVWQLKKWDMHDPKSCLAVFKANQVFGWIMLLIFSY